MVERVWSARAANRENAAAYAAYFLRVMLPELRAVPGYCAAKVVQRDRDGGIEVVVVSFWESLEAIRSFAGEDISRAVVHPEAAALFADYDHSVRHYDVVVEDL